MNSFTRPTEESLYETRRKVDGSCPSCHGSDIAAYRVLTDGGWWDVVKCQTCLYSLERKRSENQYAPCTLLWNLM
jgi:vanillate/4-hydroxybenzoate decarboxylase subunit D